MFRNARPVGIDSREIRDLIIEWIEKHGQVPTEATGNWRIVLPESLPK